MAASRIPLVSKGIAPLLLNSAKAGKGILAFPANKIDPVKWAFKAYRAGKNAKTAFIGGKVLQNMVTGLTAGVISEAIAFRKEDEAQIADIFPDGTPILEFLQTDENDSAFTAKLKNAVASTILGVGINGVLGAGISGLGAVPVVERALRGTHKAVNAKTAEEAADAVTEMASAKVSLDSIAKTADLVKEVDALREQAYETGEELSQLIIDNIPPSKVSEAQEIAKLREAGEEIFPYDNNTWSIRVTNWEDAYKVTPEQYEAQLYAADPEGNLGISHMNSAVEAAWKQRGLVSGEGLYSPVSKERTDTLNTILDYYKDKWELGKSKISVKLGDWANIPDGRTRQYKNGNIIIQLNKNAKDIYASLRSELEHARDLIKGEVPQGASVEGSGVHFARYKGDNEAGIAPAYAYKKSKSRAKAAEMEQYKPISREELDNYSITSHKDNEFGIKDPDIIDPDYEPYTVHSITDKEGKNLAHIRITKGNYIDWSLNHGIEKGVARKLIAKLLYENKYPALVWDGTTKSSVKSYERFCREFPDLIDRVQFTDKFNNPVDFNDFLNYTQGKGALSEGSQGNNAVSGRGKILSGNDIADNQKTVSEAGGNQRTNRVNQSGVLDESNSAADERGSLADTNNESGLRHIERLQLPPETDTNTIGELTYLNLFIL